MSASKRSTSPRILGFFETQKNKSNEQIIADMIENDRKKIINNLSKYNRQFDTMKPNETIEVVSDEWDEMYTKGATTLMKIIEQLQINLNEVCHKLNEKNNVEYKNNIERLELVEKRTEELLNEHRNKRGNIWKTFV